ncbi:Phosphatidic acid phosphatase type 2/haloperoxidase [Corchorus olitorius]|uniref:Phosphatidic acid phosphatase type 2/haloperoxidase n=1 Tax=Corchorus olitorius TaxID=93759 RepID=A0A1R3KCD5_9ROSI|nr:Phosphatidic acid phosphatase type 2/haloperoxidase [Corchorus olitorius]
MREVQLGSHTIKSHGVTVARTHMHDWLILLLLVLIWIGLLIMNPFYRFVGKDMMEDLKYPLKSNTVPVWAVPMYAVVLPTVIFIIVYIRRRDVYDLHHAILGLLFSVLVTAVITDAIKNAVGRPRPDFFWRCFPDGKDEYDKWGNVICHGVKSVIKEGHKSFPSGHTSWSFAGLGFLSLYLSGKIQAFDRRGHVAKLCIVFLPLLVAALVGISRVDDYWHHWQDVFAGGLLGLVVATFCYLQFFPPPYHTEWQIKYIYLCLLFFALLLEMCCCMFCLDELADLTKPVEQGWGPYAYFRVLEESVANTQANNVASRQDAMTGEVQIGNHEEERTDNGFMGLHLARSASSTMEDIESGK